jgi:selT/selW/selH-like putative selenoprotein
MLAYFPSLDGIGTYKRQAKLLETALKEQKPELAIVVQPYGKPRTGKGTFNIYLVKDKKETLLWDGKSKGPPRKLKFPQAETILESLNA